MLVSCNDLCILISLINLIFGIALNPKNIKHKTPNNPITITTPINTIYYNNFTRITNLEGTEIPTAMKENAEFAAKQVTRLLMSIKITLRYALDLLFSHLLQSMNVILAVFKMCYGFELQ